MRPKDALKRQALLRALRLRLGKIERDRAVTITVVICTRNRPALLERCLSGVQKLSPLPDKVLVIDNTDGDPETERVTRQFGAKYMIEPRCGLNRVMNRALAERETNMVAFLRDDVIPARGSARHRRL